MWPLRGEGITNGFKTFGCIEYVCLNTVVDVPCQKLSEIGSFGESGRNCPERKGWTWRSSMIVLLFVVIEDYLSSIIPSCLFPSCHLEELEHCWSSRLLFLPLDPPFPFCLYSPCTHQPSSTEWLQWLQVSARSKRCPEVRLWAPGGKLHDVQRRVIRTTL